MGDPLIHTQFATFEILERVKPGGMAIVYKAIDHTSKETIALKILQENLTIYDDIVQRFRQEAMIARKLRHPHIVPCYDFGEHDGRLYIAMEYMPGGSIADELSIDPVIMIERTINVLCQIADALDYAHSENVVHRDLKLGNILISSKGDFLLTDFGIARVMDATQYTRTGQPMPGTAKYMSPEQAAGKTELDFRSDIYSLAVIAYLLCTGRYPFTGVNEMVVLNQHMYIMPPKPTSVNPDLPPAVDDVLLKGLSKKPEHRYPTASALAVAFQEAMRGHEELEVTVNMRAENPASGENAISSLTTFDTSHLTPISKQQHQPKRMPVALIASLFTILLLGLGGVGFIVFRGNDDLPLIVPSATSEIVVVAATETPTHTPTSTNTVTATHTVTEVITETPAFTATWTETPIPTPPYTSLTEVMTVFLGMPSPNRFDCPKFIQAYEYLQREIAAQNPDFVTAAILIDDDLDPLRQIYNEGCLPQSNITDAAIDFNLYNDMLSAVQPFQ